MLYGLYSYDRQKDRLEDIQIPDRFAQAIGHPIHLYGSPVKAASGTLPLLCGALPIGTELTSMIGSQAALPFTGFGKVLVLQCMIIMHKAVVMLEKAESGQWLLPG